MPGHEGSPYWAVVDFDSEEDDVPTPPPSHRVYLDPWDSEAQGIIPTERPESSQEDNLNSFAGEPVSASFYYVPTKNYDSGEEPPLPSPRRKMSVREDRCFDDADYGRKTSRSTVQDMAEQAIYAERPINRLESNALPPASFVDLYPPHLLGRRDYIDPYVRDRRRSAYIEEPVYIPHPMAPMIYEPVYGLPPPPGYLAPRPRTRVSLPQHLGPMGPEYLVHVQPRRHSRLPEPYEQFVYESLSPDYEDWARPFPKTAPDNFHLSRYGHLQIDYSFSWHSLDRLIRNQ